MYSAMTEETRMQRTITCPNCGHKANNSLGSHVRYQRCGVTDEQLFWLKVDRRGPNECWLWQGAKERHGYGHFRANGKDHRAHKYAWELANGKPFPKGMDAMHSCDVKGCVNPAHVRPATHAENMADCHAKMRHAYGERNHKAKLTAAQVIEIRRLRKEGLKLRELSERFPISQTVVQQICSGRKWRHLL